MLHWLLLYLLSALLAVRSSSTRVFTVPEVAKELRLGRTATYELVRAGTIRSVRLGRKIRVPAAALVELLGEHVATEDQDSTASA